MDEHKEQEARSVWERMRILEEALEKAPHAARVLHDDIMCGREGAPVTPQGATYAVEKLLNALRASVAVGPDPDTVDDPPECDVEGLFRVLGSNDRPNAPVSDAEADYICRLASRLPSVDESAGAQRLLDRLRTPGTGEGDGQALDGALHSVWLHGSWRWLTQKMTTEQREAATDAVERYSARLDPEEPTQVERWWRVDVVSTTGPDDSVRHKLLPEVTRE